MADSENENGEFAPYPGMNQGVDDVFELTLNFIWYLAFHPSEKLPTIFTFMPASTSP